MKYMRFANVILFVVNIALFCLWWSLIRIDASPEAKTPEYQVSYISLLITILGVVLGGGALVLAGLGFLGFQTVLERAEAKADRTARDVVAQLNTSGELAHGSSIPQMAQTAQMPDVGDAQEVND